jgi:hypothetical protein
MSDGPVRLAVAHGVIVIGDRDEPAPASFEGAAVVATDSVVAVATRHAVDGDVTIWLAREGQEEPPQVPLFAGRLTLPSPATMCDTSNDVLLETAAPDGFALVTVWANEARHADEILVAVE